MPIADPRYLLILLPCVAVFYALRASNHRMYLMLGVSYLYYLTFPVFFLPVLLGLTGFTYLAGRLIQRNMGKRSYPIVVGAIIVLGLTPMVVFKTLSVLPSDPWIYPVGLSFYTFTCLAYLVDVALDVVDVERKPLRLGLAAALFPVVTLGPLLRTSYFGRLEFKGSLDRKRLTHGVAEILLGMALKLGFADPLARSSDAVYAHVYSASGIELFVGSVVEAFQIYADWQGYSLIAIGSARLFGIDFPANFRQPYLSTNIGEFWRSWHVALVNWFRDYVFMPLRLQLSKYPALAIPVATFVTFALLGAWHVKGGWGYAMYGVVNGLLLVYSQQTLGRRDKMWQAMRIPGVVLTPARVLTTFMVIVMTVPLARSASLTEAVHIYGEWSSGDTWSSLWLMATSGQPVSLPHVQVALVIGLILIIIAGDGLALSRRTGVLKQTPVWLNGVIYAACVSIIVWHVVANEPPEPFVYFRY